MPEVLPEKLAPISEDKVDHEFCERIKSLINEAGSAEKLAKKSGVGARNIIKYASGQGDPSRKRLVKLAKAMDVDILWLASGEGGMRREEETIKTVSSIVSEKNVDYSQRQDDRFCYIPLYNVAAAAGSGAEVDREFVVDFLAFKAEWIRVQLGLSPQDLYLIHVNGESMEPTLRPGDTILIDHRAANEFPSDGIYVLRMNNTLLVKRLQMLPGSVIKVTSDNPAYEPFTLDLKQSASEVGIIGRVVWCGRRM